ncbi:hypothetical protein FN846DRAFT_909521 [Sphaerosporella brunnea]|uniref:Uncharacterized protein n=1 Tax=Sphaerosporella brunnea TaxID=1250544 RepID=A0A5J5EQI4_9PEZI|nr:hypothetical protein FN846DRAFT_909521 [Sphaerosporella brunnea]
MNFCIRLGPCKGQDNGVFQLNSARLGDLDGTEVDDLGADAALLRQGLSGNDGLADAMGQRRNGNASTGELDLSLSDGEAHSDPPTDMPNSDPTPASTSTVRPLPAAAVAVIATASIILFLAAIVGGYWYNRRREPRVRMEAEEEEEVVMKQYAGEAPLVDRKVGGDGKKFAYPTLDPYAEHQRYGYEVDGQPHPATVPRER